MRHDFRDQFGEKPDIRSWLYADAFLREHRPEWPAPDLPFFYRGPRARIIPLTEPGLWLPLSCAIAFINQTKAASADTNSVTSPSVDSSAANFHVVVIADYAILAVGTMTSANPSLTWNVLTASTTGTDSRCLIFWAVGTGGATMTYTYTRSGGFPALAAKWFSGVAQSGTFRDESQNNAINTGGTAGTAPVGANTDVIIAGLSYTLSSTPSINLSFSTPNTQDYAGGVNWGVSASYILADDAKNPTWTVSGVTRTWASQLAAFKVAAAASDTSLSPFRRLREGGQGANLRRHVPQRRREFPFAERQAA